ncbi:MAG: T9SS type A sorting domain-containing protein [Ignavibacteriales bacterium]|nr:T9SS type A sorting domain-containing protein [Ignavibacteriales bacterium]
MRKWFIIVCITGVNLFFHSLHAQSTPWVTAYYAGWTQGWYNNGVLPAELIDYSAVTHIIHFGLVPRSDGTVNGDANSVVKSNSDALIPLAHAAGKKVLICVGGWGTDREFRNATGLLTRSAFIGNLIAFMQDRGYDGIDIDWEPLSFSDLSQYTVFITELRARLDHISPRPLLTAATSWEAPIFALVHDKLDQINLMTYDLSGAWPGWVAWHNSPVYNGGFRFASNGRLIPSADDMIEEFILAGVPKNKLGIGIDFYGYVWSGGSGTSTGGVTAPRQTWSSPPQVRVNVPYYSLIQQYYAPHYYRWDSIAHASYLSIDNPGSADDKFVTYDNEMTARMKMEYVRSKGIGGVIIWELGGGMLPKNFTNRDRLLQSVKKAMLNETGSPPPPQTTITPAHFTRGVPLKPTLRWNAPNDVPWYRVQIAYDSLFTSPVLDQSWIIDSTYTVNYLPPDTTYYWRVRSLNAFAESEWTQTSIFGTAIDSLIPQSWQFISNTGDNATVLIPSTVVPRVGKRVLQNGDLIGVFYKQNTSLLCAGYAQWEQGKNISITVWGDNSLTTVKDGFASGDTMYFKFWERKFGIENNASPGFSSGGPTYSKDGIYTLQSLVAPADNKQFILLQSGWNMISSYIRNTNSSIEHVTSPIRSNLILVKDNNGNIFLPDSNINTIGAWRLDQGYQFYMRDNDTLIMQGDEVYPESTAISLSAGWNMVPYLRTSPMSPDTALTTVKADLTLVKNNDGKIYWPEFGINTMKMMHPGQGYKISVKQNDILTYPPNSGQTVLEKAAAAEYSDVRMEYYPEVSGTGSSAILLIQSPQLSDGDEIGAWSGKEILVGTGKAISGKCVVILWGKDPLLSEQNGADEGEPLRLTLWKKNLRKEARLMISSLKDGISKTHVSPSLKYSAESVLIGTSKNVPFTHYLEQNYPNPFNPATMISYGIAERVHVRLDVFNSIGQRVALLRNAVQEPGEYTVEFRTTRSIRLASGVYYCRLQAGDFVSTKKMLMLK